MIWYHFVIHPPLWVLHSHAEAFWCALHASQPSAMKSWRHSPYWRQCLHKGCGEFVFEYICRLHNNHAYKFTHVCCKTSKFHKSSLVEFSSRGRVCFLTLLAGRKCKLRGLGNCSEQFVGCSWSRMLPYKVPVVFFVKIKFLSLVFRYCGCKDPKLQVNHEAPCHPQSQTETDREVQRWVHARWTAMRHLTHLIHVTWFKAKPKPWKWKTKRWVEHRDSSYFARHLHRALKWFKWLTSDLQTQGTDREVRHKEKRRLQNLWGVKYVFSSNGIQDPKPKVTMRLPPFKSLCFRVPWRPGSPTMHLSWGCEGSDDGWTKCTSPSQVFC